MFGAHAIVRGTVLIKAPLGPYVVPGVRRYEHVSPLTNPLLETNRSDEAGVLAPPAALSSESFE